MGDRICITVPATRVREAQTWCFEIPLLFRWWVNPNPPDPDKDGPLPDPWDWGPLPEPWLHGPGIDAKLGLSLRVLASIHALSAFLPGEASQTVRRVVRAEAKRFQLPPGLELHLMEGGPG